MIRYLSRCKSCGGETRWFEFPKQDRLRYTQYHRDCDLCRSSDLIHVIEEQSEDQSGVG